MECFVRVFDSPQSARDVVIHYEADHTVGDLAVAVMTEVLGEAPAAIPPLALAKTGRLLDSETRLVDSGIVSGDDVLVGTASRVAPTPAIPLRAVSLDVITGPDTGMSVIMLQGRFSVGRGSAMHVPLSDRTVSTPQFDVIVGPDFSVTIEPHPDVTNSTYLNHAEVVATATVEETDVIGIGTTRLAIRPFVRAPAGHFDRLGQIEFHRTPYRQIVVTKRVASDIGNIPNRPEPRRFQTLTAVAPLAGGLAMFAFSRQPQFLALTALSPIALAAGWWEDRKSGRSKYRTDKEAFAGRVADRRTELLEAVEAERIERLRASPDLAELGRRAELRTADLWARGRTAGDFLALRVGIGTVATLVEAPLPNGGDESLRDDAVAAAEGTGSLVDSPVVVDIRRCGVVGICGDDDAVSGLTTSFAVQAACLHSPEDLTIVALVDSSRGVVEALKWLPHCRSATSPLGGRHLATDREDAADVLGRLVELAEFRASTVQGNQRPEFWPHVLVFLDDELGVDPAITARLLDLGPLTSMSVVGLASHAGRLPRQATQNVECALGDRRPVARIWAVSPEVADQHVQLETLRADVADRTARALAPVRDASTASETTSIPSVVPLFDVLGTSTPDARWITERWLSNRRYSLEFPIGIGASGLITLDLVGQGPHALIGGTSGAGKSELLQSIVAGLAAEHSPTRLNFLFIDYKGGASSTVFHRLPHTVGYVTNLDAELSGRALTSLRAELNRRMKVMEGKAKDLEQMLADHEHEAPASLVIVVDEFATLVKEVPDFVAGIVDIAQRGRSLGIHLILATQRPSGSVNENILANTNLRISLRMLDRGESSSIIGSADAADIPVPLRGRCFARLGPRTLVNFQSAYTGAPAQGALAAAAVSLMPFEDGPIGTVAVTGGANTGATQLDVLLDAIVAANEQLHLPVPRRPWRDVLASMLTLDELLDDPRAEAAHTDPGRVVAFGMVDLPEQQDQAPLVVDLEQGGGLLVYGSGGSGKTTLLRTIAAGAATCSGPEQVAVVAFDFASRALRSIAPLPHVIAVAGADDLESVTRQIAMLTNELERRRALLADAAAENLTSYNERHQPLARVLVLIDGFGALSNTFSGGSSMTSAVPMENWLEQLVRIIIDGRQIGIHTVITADRRNSVPVAVQSSVANRLILSHADEGGYTDHGVPTSRARGLHLEPGRGLWQASATVQVACVSTGASAAEQAEALQVMGRTSHGRPPAELLTAPLPELVPFESLAPANRPSEAVIGISDVVAAPVRVDLSRSDLVFAGGPGSGRSTAILAAAASMQAFHDVWVVGPAQSPVGDGGNARTAVGSAVEPLLQQLLAMSDIADVARRSVLFVDDADLLDDPMLNDVWESLIRVNVRFVVSLETRQLSGFTMSPLMNHVRRARRVVLLQPNGADEVFQTLGTKAPIRPGTKLPPGRGVLVQGMQASVVQVAVFTRLGDVSHSP